MFGEFFRSPKAIIAGTAVACALLLGAWKMSNSDDAGSLINNVNQQTWIDTDGVVFQRNLTAFDDAPATGPTGKPAFRAELCYWTAEGGIKETPTPVLLNRHVGRPEPTYCPDCGRLVVPLNPPPVAGVPAGQQHPPKRRTE